MANGFEDIEAVSIVDVLRRGGIEVVTASIHGTPGVRSAHGIDMRADALFDDVEDDDFDAIVLPGGGEGTENLKACGPLIRRLQRQHEENRLICAICAAPTVLVAAGVLERFRKRLEKSTRPSKRPIGGIRMSLTNDVTILPKAAPMMIPTAMSRTLPRMMNFLNSSIMKILLIK